MQWEVNNVMTIAYSDCKACRSGFWSIIRDSSKYVLYDPFHQVVWRFNREATAKNVAELMDAELD